MAEMADEIAELLLVAQDLASAHGTKPPDFRLHINTICYFATVVA